MSTWRMQVERARQRSRRQRLTYIDTDARLERLGIKRTASTAGNGATPSTGRIVRQYETTLRIR
jgi:hypothetical protein